MLRRASGLLALGLLACGPNGASEQPRPTVPTTRQARDDVPAWVDGGDRFALALLGRLAATDGNLFFAPGNLRTALAMTYAGAAGTTADEMARTLHFTALPGLRVHAAQAAAAGQLQEGAGHVTLRAANRLWGAQGEPFVAEYVERTRSYYGAELVGVDFAATEQARQTINAWVSQQTEGKIAELLARQTIDASTRLVLTSAIYFKGTWLRAFDPARTQDQPFHVPFVAVAPAVPTMQQKAKFAYAEVADAQVLELPYTGGRLAMTIVLPRAPDGLPALTAGLDPARLAGWLAALRPTEVRVALPRFTTRARFELADTLAAMGMPTAFTGAADFSGMSRAGGLFISRVIHEAFVDVNEAGTEAAAATAVVMTRSAPMNPPPSFTADRPFLYLIRDTGTGQILFLGRVLDPRG
jgi:serpin B